MVTPNMHMHCHLHEVLLDYGPVYSFWCFSYERYNGILGNQPNNNKEIESQLMKRFLADNFAYSLLCPSNFHEEFHQLSMPLPRSLLQTMNPVITVPQSVEVPKCYTRKIFTSTEFERGLIVKLLEKLEGAEIEINDVIRQYSSITINGNRLAVYDSHPCVAMIKWDKELFGDRPLHHSTWLDSTIIRPASIQHVWQIAYRVATASSFEFHTRLFMQVNWYLEHPALSELGKPAQIWCNNLFEVSGTHSFVPVHLYYSRCIHCIMPIGGEHVLLVVPLVNH